MRSAVKLSEEIAEESIERSDDVKIEEDQERVQGEEWFLYIRLYSYRNYQHHLHSIWASSARTCQKISFFLSVFSSLW